MQRVSRIGAIPGKELQRTGRRLYTLLYHLHCIGPGKKVRYIRNHGRNVPGGKRTAAGTDIMETFAFLHGKATHGFGGIIRGRTHADDSGIAGQ